MLTIEGFCFYNDFQFNNVNRSIEAIKENLLLPMAYFVALICPRFINNAAWCQAVAYNMYYW